MLLGPWARKKLTLFPTTFSNIWVSPIEFTLFMYMTFNQSEIEAIKPKHSISMPFPVLVLNQKYISSVFPAFICMTAFADEEKLFHGGQPDADWEEFAIVAADLLERIQTSMSYHNSPYASSTSDNDDDDFATEQTMKITQTGFKVWLTNS